MKALESLCESSKDAGLVLSALRCVAPLDRGEDHRTHADVEPSVCSSQRDRALLLTTPKLDAAAPS